MVIKVIQPDPPAPVPVQPNNQMRGDTRRLHEIRVDDPAYPSAWPKRKTDNKRRLQLLLSYAPDWIITIALTGLFYLLDNVQGFRRHFSLTDTSIQYPYIVDERVPMWLLVVICLACPLVVMPSVNLLTVRSWWDFHNSWLGVVLAFGLTGTITNIVKITVGRPRPDFIARCLPMIGSENRPIFGLSDHKICTQEDEKIMMDGFRSFFSGHSSLSFAGLGFLFFYVSGKMHLFDKRGHAGKAWIAFVPLVGATLIAITRTTDYRHHWQDVFIGGIIGLGIAHFSYRQYFPPLAHPYSHRPYSPRVPRAADDKQEDGPAQVVDKAPSSSNTGSAATGSARPQKDLVQRTFSDEGTIQRQNPDLSEMWTDGPSNRMDQTRTKPTDV